MAALTRRTFLTGTSAAAATLGILTAIPMVGGARDVSTPPSPELPVPALSEPLMAYVRDPVLGELALLVGTREVILRDPELVARLVTAAIGRNTTR